MTHHPLNSERAHPPVRRARAGLWVIFMALVCGWGACTLNGPTGTESTTPGDGAVAGTGGALGTSSGVARGVALMNLSFDQASTLCDWTNRKQGGYGRLVNCSSGSTQSTSASSAGCVQSTLGLGGKCVSLVVGDIEDCANAIGPDLCRLENAPECSAVFTCASM